MGKMNADFTFTGSLGVISVYKRRDIDKPIIRLKKGPTKEAIKKSPKFENTRRNISEFGGRSAATGWIMHSLIYLKPLADFNIAGPLNSLLRPLQVSDAVNGWGERSVLITQNPRLLAGFDLNRNSPFNSIIRNPVQYTFSRDTRKASLQIPALLPGINFHAPDKYPVYSIMGSLGVVPDMIYHPTGYKPTGDYEPAHYVPQIAQTDWYPVLNGSPEVTLDLAWNGAMPDDSFTLILAIGIRFGTVGANGSIQQVRYAGSAKIIAAV